MPDSQLVYQLRRQKRLFVKVHAHTEEVRGIALFFSKQRQKKEGKRQDEKRAHEGVYHAEKFFFAFRFFKGSVFDLIGLVRVGVPLKDTDNMALE